MNLKTYEHSTNYVATVIKLPTKQAVEGLDNLIKVTVFGNDCLISKDSPEGLYLFFPSGTQLSKEFLWANNLYRESQLNLVLSEKGFFEPNGRVKAIKFRGVISTGFVIPVSSLLPLAISKQSSVSLKEGDTFNEIDQQEICRKYVIQSNPCILPGSKQERTTKINNRLQELMIPNQFRFHEETTHLANNIHKFNPEDIIVITDKWHGSSCIISKVYVNKKLKFHQKVLNKLGAKIPNREYGYIYSSGKPKSNLPKGIVGEWENSNKDFYGDNIWKEVFEFYKYALEEGISLYGEIVGYTRNGSFIQKGYDYGCTQLGLKGNIKYSEYDSREIMGFYRFVVYRITYTKPDGNKIEFSWQQIKDYCKKYDLEVVKEIYFGQAKNWGKGLSLDDQDSQTWNNSFFEAMQRQVEQIGNCVYCVNKVPAEGIVVRIDGKGSYNAFKVKSKLFLKKESDDLDKGETNIEDTN